MATPRWVPLIFFPDGGLRAKPIRATRHVDNISEQQRGKLGFKEAATASFDFLNQLGFRLIGEEITLLRYESSTVFVNVYHGRASYELGVEIGRVTQREKHVHIFSIVRWAGAEKAEGFGHHVMFQVSSREGVQRFVPQIAALVKKYAIPLLLGEEQAFQSVFAFAARLYADEMKNESLRVLRGEAEGAWQAKDFARVVEVYGGIRADLTEAEVKKLAYAKRRMAQGGWRKG